ncbi:MAG: tetratricopeptide repeat protein [Gemmataceae bacterium]|nr:tetratricopeptide repeat protein [Gemmataceae bacterium]
MTYRVILSALAMFGFVALCARGDVIIVRGKDPLSGTVLKEGATEVIVSTFVAKKKTDVKIPSADVIDIVHDAIGPASLIIKGGAFKDARDAEKEADEGATPKARAKAMETAITKFKETLTKMNRDTQGQKYAVREIEYRIAMLTVKQLSADQTTPEKAIGALQKFNKAFPDSWQLNVTMPLMAQLHMEAGEFKQAEAIFEEMSGMSEFPKSVQQEAELKVVRVSVKAGNIAQAKKKLDALEKKPGASKEFVSLVQLERANILVSLKKFDEAIPILQKAVKDNTDKQIKAIAHNTLGECLFKAEKYSEAVWEFLWVDAVFNQDKQQQAKSLYFLVQTFTKLGDGPRAQECLETLINDRQFSGTEYQRKAIAEKGK